MIRATCKKCGQADWGIWTSSSSGKSHRYCRACRRERASAYSERKKRSDGKHTKREWLSKLAEFDKCPECNRPWKAIPRRPDQRYKYVWTKDYIIPLIAGGSDAIENIQPLCYQCNYSKGSKITSITLAIRKGLKNGEQAIKNGHVLTHKQAMKRLEQWLK